MRTLLKEFDIFFLGTREGVCPLCEELKTLLFLRDGITACEDCLDILVSMLEVAREPVSGEKMRAGLNCTI